MEEAHRIQRREGAIVALYSPTKLKEDFPWLNTEGLVLGSLGLENEGWFDPWGLLNGLRQKAASNKTQFIQGMFVFSKCAFAFVSSVCLSLCLCVSLSIPLSFISSCLSLVN